MTRHEYVQILFDDCGLTTVKRNDYLQNRFRRKIHHLDELSSRELCLAIDDLKEKKQEIALENLEVLAWGEEQHGAECFYNDYDTGDDDVPF